MDDALGLSACACKALSSYVHAGSRSSRMILAADLCFLSAALLSAQCCIFLLISANMWYGADRPHLLCDAGVDGVVPGDTSRERSIIALVAVA